MTDLNEIFSSYQRSVGTADEKQYEGFLCHACQRIALPIRMRFTAPEKVNGDLFDEAIEDVILSVLRRASEIRPDTFEAYFKQSVHNRMVDKVRKAKRDRHVSLEDSEIDPVGRSIQDMVETLDTRERLLHRMEKLTPAERETLAEIVEGNTYQQAADIQHTPVGTIKSRLARVHEKMRPMWQEAVSSGVEITGSDVRKTGKTEGRTV